MNFTKDVHYSPELEKAIIGISMIEKDAFSRIYGILEPECFYSSGHQLVFKTISDIFVNGIPIDTFTVVDQLKRVKQVESIENVSVLGFILSLTNSVVSSAHLEYHSQIVKIMWMERELIKLTHGGTELSGDIRKQIYDLQTKLQALQTKSVEHEWTDMTQLMVELYQHQETIKLTGGVGIHTGIPAIDRENGGLHDGQMIIIGARPSVGKSALAGGIALSMAKKTKTVGIISLEMSNVEIAARLAAVDTETDFKVLFRGLYRDENETHAVYRRIAQSTSTLPIFVTDKTSVNVAEIRAKAQKLKAINGLDCLMIDYLQLIDVPETYSRTRENEIAKISRSCKIMAKEMNIPVILLCQLNREPTKRKGAERYPQLSDLRESGSLEQDADVVMFLHRDFVSGQEIDENGRSTEFDADLVIRKWRNGRSNFIVKMDFNPGQMKFTQKENAPVFTSAPINLPYKDKEDPF